MTSLFWSEPRDLSDYDQTPTEARLDTPAVPLAGNVSVLPHGRLAGKVSVLPHRLRVALSWGVWTVIVLGVSVPMVYMLSRMPADVPPRLILALAVGLAVSVGLLVSAVILSRKPPSFPALRAEPSGLEGDPHTDTAHDRWVWPPGEAPDDEDVVRLG